MKIEIDNPFSTGLLATLGVVVGLGILTLGNAALGGEVTQQNVRDACVEHGGVRQFNDEAWSPRVRGGAAVICTDGHFQILKGS